MDCTGNSTVKFIWKRSEVKEIFQKYGLWPIFIGVTTDTTREVKSGLMPVVLTEEQNRYIENRRKEVQNPSHSRKRKFDEISESSMSSMNEASSNPSKKQNTSIYSLISWSWLQSLYDVSIRPIFSFIGLLSNDDNLPKHSSEDHDFEFTEDNLEYANKQPKSVTVFEELKSKGYFLGPGGNYGGDYTLYQGKSPSESHATSTVRVVNRDSAKVSAREIIALSRVQTQVNKEAVFAFVKKPTHSKFTVPHLADESDSAVIETNVNDSKQLHDDLMDDNYRYLRIKFQDVSRRM